MGSLKNQPLVSIVVPMYRVERYLKRCLDSLLNQTLDDIEIILVDDGSPDGIAEIYRGFMARDQRLRLVVKENQGLGLARNSGLEIAKGKYVAFVDSDDYVDCDMYSKLSSAAIETEADAVFCGFAHLDEELKTTEYSEVEGLTVFENREGIQEVLQDMIACEPSSSTERRFRMSAWHAVYRRDLLENHDILFESERAFLSEDILFHIDFFAKASRVAFIPDSLYYYCYNETSLTKSFREDRFEKSVVLHDEMTRRLVARGFDISLYKTRVARFFYGYARYAIIQLAKSNIAPDRKREYLKAMKKHEGWKILDKYPIDDMPLKHRFFLLMLRWLPTHLFVKITNALR